MMRITTNGTLRGYKSNLMCTANRLNTSREKVLTQRNFNSYAQDPASATQAFKLRRLFSRNEDQVTNSTALISKYESAWKSVGTVKGLVETAAKDAALRGTSDATAAGRQPLGEVLSSTAKSIVQTLNAQYSDSFIFGGNNAGKVPFSWSDTDGLLFQGISVDAGGVGTRPEGTPPNPSEKTIGSAWQTYYQNNPEFSKLAQMVHETAYVDVGAGLSEDASGNLDPASAFNSAISGIDILGFGVDKDGDPKNSVSLIKQLSGIFKRCNSESGAYDSDKDKADVSRLTDKLQKSLSALTNKWTYMDGQADYLNSNKDRLTATSDTLNEQILSIEQADLSDAITDYSWAQYCYNSALKVGNSILSQSLIDYMN